MASEAGNEHTQKPRVKTMVFFLSIWNLSLWAFCTVVCGYNANSHRQQGFIVLIICKLWIAKTKTFGDFIELLPREMPPC